MYYTYIIQSEKSFHWYIGFTEDPNKRLEENNSGLNSSTRNRGPWRLIFLKSFNEKGEANQFEIYLKKLRNKSYIRRVFSDYFLEELSSLIPSGGSGNSAARQRATFGT